jgi:hypothetical protein
MNPESITVQSKISSAIANSTKNYGTKKRIVVEYNIENVCCIDGKN